MNHAHRREPRTADSRKQPRGAGLFSFYGHDDLDITWREIAYAALPAIGVIVGAWLALVYVLTGGPK